MANQDKPTNQPWLPKTWADVLHGYALHIAYPDLLGGKDSPLDWSTILIQQVATRISAGVLSYVMKNGEAWDATNGLYAKGLVSEEGYPRLSDNAVNAFCTYFELIGLDYNSMSAEAFAIALGGLDDDGNVLWGLP